MQAVQEELIPFSVKNYGLEARSFFGRISQLQAAFDDTFVLLIQNKPLPKIYHVTQDGDAIRRYDFQSFSIVNSFLMPRDDQILVPLFDEKKIKIIKLKEKKTKFRTYFFDNKHSQYRFEYFAFDASKDICFWQLWSDKIPKSGKKQKQKTGRSQIKVTYFATHLSQQRHTLTYHILDNDKYEFDSVCKLDSDSSIAIFKRSEFKNQLIILLHKKIPLKDKKRPEQKYQSNVQYISIPLTSMNRIFVVNKVHRINVQFLLLQSWDHNFSKLVDINNLSIESVYQNYYSGNISTPVVADLHDWIVCKRQNSNERFSNVQMKLLFFNKQTGYAEQYFETPESITPHMYHVQACQHNSFMMIEWFYEHDNFNRLRIRKTNTCNDKYLFYLHCLLWIEKDFDDDLLQDTIEVLKKE